MNFPPIFCLSLPVVPVFGQIMPEKTILGRECSIRRTSEWFQRLSDSIRRTSDSFRRTSEWFRRSSDRILPSRNQSGERRNGSDVRRNGSNVCRIRSDVRRNGSNVCRIRSDVRRNGSDVRRTESYLPGTNPANVGISAHRPRHGAAAGAGAPFPAMPRPAVRAALEPGGGSHGPVV